MDKLCQCRREKLEKVSTGFISASELEDELELIKFSPCTCNTKTKEETKTVIHPYSTIEPTAEEDIRKMSWCKLWQSKADGKWRIRMECVEDAVPSIREVLTYSCLGAKKGQVMVNTPGENGNAVFEVKPACDHIVGVQFGCEECWEKNELVVISECSNTEDITDDRFEKFYFCPRKGCAAPIDWEAIEKQLNQKKDD